MASKYNPNRWELYNPDLPDEAQPHSFITKRKLEKMEKGIEEANIRLEVGEINMGDTYNVSITEDTENKTRKLNITFPPAGVIGEVGKSAYEIWLELGNEGTEQEFIDYLKGQDGKDGKDGKDGLDGEAGPAGESAYQSWLNLGNTGSMEDFLNSLKGEKGQDGSSGKSAYEIWISQGNVGTESDFLNSLHGKSAYEIWLENGPSTDIIPDEEVFLMSLKGENGDSAYQCWLNMGNTGTESDFLNSLKGEDGESAYELWKKLPGNENKLITDFFESLKGEQGPEGPAASVDFVDFK